MQCEILNSKQWYECALFLNAQEISTLCAAYTSKQPLVVLSFDAATVISKVMFIFLNFTQRHMDAGLLVDVVI
jgi:hypothetical protein